MKTITVRTRVQTGGIAESDPPMLSYHKIAMRPDGKRRIFAQAVKVMDADLLARLRREIPEGDEIEVVIEQRLGDGVASVLLDFSRIDASMPVTAP